MSNETTDEQFCMQLGEDADKIKDLTGGDLADALVELARLRIANGHVVDPMLTIVKKYSFPNATQCTAQSPFIPHIVHIIHKDLKVNKKGRVILDCPADVDNMGKKLVAIAERAMDVEKCQEVVTNIVNDSEHSFLKHFDAHRGLKSIYPHCSTETLAMACFLMKNIVPSSVRGVQVRSSVVHGANCSPRTPHFPSTYCTSAYTPHTTYAFSYL